VAARAADAEVAGGRLAAVGLAQVLDAAAVALDYRARRVARSIVDDDDAERVMPLSERAVKRGREIAGGVVAGDGDINAGHRRGRPAIAHAARSRHPASTPPPPSAADECSRADRRRAAGS